MFSLQTVYCDTTTTTTVVVVVVVRVVVILTTCISINNCCIVRAQRGSLSFAALRDNIQIPAFQQIRLFGWNLILVLNFILHNRNNKKKP